MDFVKVTKIPTPNEGCDSPREERDLPAETFRNETRRNHGERYAGVAESTLKAQRGTMLKRSEDR